MIGRIVTVVVLFGLVMGLSALGQEKKKKEKDPLEGKKGTVIGIVVGKEKAYIIEVKADGEEKGRKYFPRWTKEDSGFDKKTLKAFSELKIGSRVEVEWQFEERLRVLSLKVLRAPKDEKK